MSDIPMEIPSVRQLVLRDARRERPVASVAMAALLCAALLMLIFVPRATVSASLAQGDDQEATSPLFP